MWEGVGEEVGCFGLDGVLSCGSRLVFSIPCAINL